MAELRENARCIFWSGALAFHGPNIFLHDKYEELLVYVHLHTPEVMVVWNMEKFSVKTEYKI